MRQFKGTLAGVLIAAGCTVSTPPAPPAPQTALNVTASFGKTWDAVIDEFASRNIPIRTLERASGLIVSETLGVNATESLDDADCGTAFGTALKTDQASFNILVRGDSSKSNVKVTARFTFGSHATTLGGRPAAITECSSTGVWETKTEAAIRDRAEGKKP